MKAKLRTNFSISDDEIVDFLGVYSILLESRLIGVKEVL